VTQEEITAEHERLQEKIAKKRAKLEIAQAKLRMLQTIICKHPEIKHGSSMGESCSWCNDCGYSD